METWFNIWWKLIEEQDCCSVVVLMWLWCSEGQCFKFPHQRCTTLSTWDLVTSGWKGEKKKAHDGEERKSCWDAASWKPSSSEAFGNAPELGNAVPGSVCAFQPGRAQGGDGRDHPARWEIIVTSASCSASSCPLWKSSLLGVHCAFSSILWWDRSNPVFCLLCELNLLLSAGCWTPGAWCATFWVYLPWSVSLSCQGAEAGSEQTLISGYLLKLSVLTPWCLLFRKWILSHTSNPEKCVYIQQPGNWMSPDLFLISCVSCGFIVCVTSPNIYILLNELFFFWKILLCLYALQNRFFHLFFLDNQTTYFLKGVGGKKREDYRNHQRKISKNRFLFFFLVDDMLRLILNLHLFFQMSLGSLRAL